METKRYKPLVDRLFWIIVIPTVILSAVATVIPALFYPSVLFVMIPVDVFVGYFSISPLFGYVELREHSVFIKYGFILKKEVSYDRIRAAEKGRKLYSDSMMSLKNAFEHVNIRYNAFDVTTVSVVGNDELVREINERCFNKRL